MVAVGVVFAVPALEALLVYNREAIANGELWRVVTGNVVHFTATHFWRDLLGFAIGGAMLEAMSRRELAAVSLASAGVIGVALYLGRPELLVYGGLSGVVTAIFVYTSLSGMVRQSSARWLHVAIVGALTAKLGYDFFETQSPLQSFMPLPEVHALGAATALLLFSVAYGRGRMRREPAAVGL